MDNKSGKLIIGMTGATGIIFGVRLLQVLEGHPVETHMVMSKWASRTWIHETPYTLEEVKQMADCHYASNDLGAKISSGSFLTTGMVVVPCSMRTLAAIAQGAGDNLIHRAADVVLKERRKLVLRIEVINLTSRPWYAGFASTAFGNAQFGQITTQANYSRLTQITARYVW